MTINAFNEFMQISTLNSCYRIEKTLIEWCCERLKNSSNIDLITSILGFICNASASLISKKLKLQTCNISLITDAINEFSTPNKFNNFIVQNGCIDSNIEFTEKKQTLLELCSTFISTALYHLKNYTIYDCENDFLLFYSQLLLVQKVKNVADAFWHIENCEVKKNIIHFYYEYLKSFLDKELTAKEDLISNSKMVELFSYMTHSNFGLRVESTKIYGVIWDNDKIFDEYKNYCCNNFTGYLDILAANLNYNSTPALQEETGRAIIHMMMSKKDVIEQLLQHGNIMINSINVLKSYDLPAKKMALNLWFKFFEKCNVE